MSEVAADVEPVQAMYAQPPSMEPIQPSFPPGFPGGMSGFPAGSGMPNLDPGVMREMMGMLRKNPGMVQSMLSAVTPEQLQAVVRTPLAMQGMRAAPAGLTCPVYIYRADIWVVLHAAVKNFWACC